MAGAFICFAIAVPALALTSEEEAFELSMPTASNLDRMRNSIHGDPENLDNYFNYAMLAKNMRKFDEAAWALESMLKRQPDLGRIKLELGLIYVELERYEEARSLFQEVLATNPPQEVKKNITPIMALLDERTRKHHVTGALITGLNRDTNANSAPSSGNVTIIDTTIPLGEGAGSTTDTHGYLAATVNHVYDIDVSRNHRSWRWKSSTLAYTTEQDALDDLNLQLYSVRSGPEVVFPENAARASLGMNYSHILLDRMSYLRNPKLDFSIEKFMTPDLIFSYVWAWEYRDYLNTPINTTYRDRTGAAFQQVFGIKHIFTPNDIFDASLTLRSEHAREAYYHNTQASGSFIYTRTFWDTMFASLMLGYKVSEYPVADLFVSSRTREDNEYSLGVTLGKRFVDTGYGNFTVTGGYQLRDVQSTLENYEYENHRFFVSVAREFEYP